MQKKTEYTRYPKFNGQTYELNKTSTCRRCIKNRPQWYGFETIGPRVYALYKCPVHGLIRKRI